MSETVLAALKVGPSTTELRELDLPPIPDHAALMKVEVAGVCGTDVSQYRLPLRGGPLVMGHENVGFLARVGKTFAAHKGMNEGDLVFLYASHHGRGRSSGVAVENKTAYLYWVRDGKVVRVELHAGRAEALKAAGLDEAS